MDLYFKEQNVPFLYKFFERNDLFPKKEHFVPSKGTICSSNLIFLEQIVPYNNIEQIYNKQWFKIKSPFGPFNLSLWQAKMIKEEDKDE